MLESAAITDLNDFGFTGAKQFVVMGVEARGDPAASPGDTSTIGGYFDLTGGHQVVGLDRVRQGGE